eukprot:Gb_18699 [translate_table: standard]
MLNRTEDLNIAHLQQSESCIDLPGLHRHGIQQYSNTSIETAKDEGTAYEEQSLLQTLQDEEKSHPSLELEDLEEPINTNDSGKLRSVWFESDEKKTPKMEVTKKQNDESHQKKFEPIVTKEEENNSHQKWLEMASVKGKNEEFQKFEVGNIGLPNSAKQEYVFDSNHPVEGQSENAIQSEQAPQVTHILTRYKLSPDSPQDGTIESNVEPI